MPEERNPRRSLEHAPAVNRSDLDQLIQGDERGWAERFLDASVYEKVGGVFLPKGDRVESELLLTFLKSSSVDTLEVERMQAAYQAGVRSNNESGQRRALREMLQVARAEYVNTIAPGVVAEARLIGSMYKDRAVYGKEAIRSRLVYIDVEIAGLVSSRWKNAGWASDGADFLKDYVKSKYLKDVYSWLIGPQPATPGAPEGGSPTPPPPSEAAKSGTADREKLGNERSLMLYMRQKAAEFIEDASSEAKLNYKTVEEEIKSGLGWNKETMARIDLFDQLPASKKEKVREAVKAEIVARCELKAAQLKDGALRRPEVEKADAQKQTIAGAGDLGRDTHRWLAAVTDLGEAGGITAERIDQAFSVFVLLGEGFPEPPEPWMRDFVAYVSAPDRKDPRKKKGFYDPAYPVETREQVLVLIRNKFGADAANIAHQLFDAYKLEGKYNWDHYLNGLYSYAGTRSALTVLEKPVYLGSVRKYKDPEFVERRVVLQRALFEARRLNRLDEIKAVEQQIKALGYGAEIQRLGLSPLDTKASDRYVDDPKVPGAKKGNEEIGLYLKKVKRGRFLRDTPWTDTTLVSVLPQEASVATVKAGDKVKTAIGEIGKLGDKENDKASKVNGAVNQLVAVASAGKELVFLGVITLDDLRAQIVNEATNIVWEFSIRNEENALPGQTKEAVKFLLPSGYNKLVELIANAVLEGASRWGRATLGGSHWPETVDGRPDGEILKNADRYAIMTDEDMEAVEGLAELRRKDALDALKRLEYVDKDKSDLIQEGEVRAMNLAMPSHRGVQLIPNYRARVAKRIAAFDRVLDAIPGVPKRPK